MSIVLGIVVLIASPGWADGVQGDQYGCSATAPASIAGLAFPQCTFELVCDGQCSYLVRATVNGGGQVAVQMVTEPWTPQAPAAEEILYSEGGPPRCGFDGEIAIFACSDPAARDIRVMSLSSQPSLSVAYTAHCSGGGFAAVVTVSCSATQFEQAPA